MIVKNSEFKSNSRTILKKWISSSTFPLSKKFQNKSKEFKEFQNHWASWNSMFRVHASHPVILKIPQLHPLVKPNLKFSNAPVTIWNLIKESGRGRSPVLSTIFKLNQDHEKVVLSKFIKNYYPTLAYDWCLMYFQGWK